MRSLLLLLWLAFLAAGGVAAQEVVVVKVRAHGQGGNEAAAVKDAIVAAVGQVSGERITATSTLRMQSRESTSGVSEHGYASDARIDSFIRGVVKASRTLSVGKDPDGIYKAEVEVDVATFRHSQQLDRIRLAVVMGSRPLPPNVGADGPRFAASLVDGMSDKLVTSGKFAVLDRRQQEQAQREFDRIAAGRTAVEEQVRLQSALPADFLVVLDVADLTWSRSLLDSERARVRARAIVYDYASGQVRQAVSANLARLVKDGSLIALGQQAGSGLAEQILENVFPARVVAYEADMLVINSGNGQFEAGDRLAIFRQGEALRDPYTKESLGHAETPVAEGVVQTVLPRVSLVRAAGVRDKYPTLRGVTLVARRSAAARAPAGLSSPAPAESSGSNTRKGNDDEKW
jgi:hypothetical protein